MESKRPYCAIAAWCVGYVLLVTGLWAQVPAVSSHVGVPQDWSERRLVFSLDGLARYPHLIEKEPRVGHQLRQRFPVPGAKGFESSAAAGAAAISPGRDRDWNVALGKGHVAANMFPAKFSFDPGAPPDCTNDYVVFGLATAGATGGQANLVAFNNLYAGTGGLCGDAPAVMFAYNVTTSTGGKITTSPVLSLDGTKIAFVESLGTSAVFHVLTWTAGQGGITTAAAPAAMTSLPFSTSTITLSSPWLDFSSDTAYIGTDDGFVYQIKNVFHGTPALAGAPWPIAVGAVALSPPVLDNRLGMLMVGSRNGNLYQINLANGALATVVVGFHGGTSPGVVAAPIVDVTNGTTFVVSANDGTSGVLVEVDTVTLTELARARIGLAAKSGTAMSIYEPAFSNNYFVSPSSGTVHLCGTGTADTAPWRYSFGFVGRTMKTVAASAQQLLTSTAARCTGWTEFFNPNFGNVTGTDFFFFGLTQDCAGAGTSGCVVDIANGSLRTAAVSGGPSGIVVDNYSTAGQASSIYLTGEKVNTAYKFTQNGLQ